MPKGKVKKIKGSQDLEPNTEPKRRTKTNKIDQELNNALALVPKEEPKDIEGIQHQGTKNLLEHHAKNKEIDLEPVRKISIDKHVESTRYKIAYVVDKLADELMREASKKTKKDKEHLKGITWSFGTLYDKLRDVQTDAQMVALPSKLLANVTEMLKAQTELLKASALSSSSKGQDPIDVTPSEDHVRSPDEGAFAEGAFAEGTEEHGQHDTLPSDEGARVREERTT